MDDEHVRGVSKGAYGNKYLLEVATAIATHQGPRFTQKAVVQLTGLDKGLVDIAIRKLESASLVVRCGSEGRECPIERQPSAYWEGVMRHLKELRAN